MIILTIPFDDFADRYEKDYLVSRGRELTINRHRLDHLSAFFKQTMVINGQDVQRFLNQFKTASRNRYRARLSHMIRWGKEWEFVSGDIPMGKDKENGARTRRLEPGEEARLLENMSQDLRDLFFMAVDTGLRRGTLLKLQWKHMSGLTGNGVLHVPAEIQKHREFQLIPMTNRVKNILIARHPDGDHYKSEQFIFQGLTGFESQWRKAKQLAGVKDLRWHDLRGEFASRISEAGVDVTIVSGLLGHKSLTTTQRYLRPRVQQFTDAINKLNGVAS